MGLGGISIWQLLSVLAIVALIVGTKRLKGLGGDVGGALKGFKQAMKDDSEDSDTVALQLAGENGSDCDRAA